jgi:hypothetical protein
MFRRPNRPKAEQRYSEAQTKRWLTWLAQKMVQESQTVFLIERMQPNWLPTKHQKWMYLIGIMLTFVLLFLLIAKIGNRFTTIKWTITAIIFCGGTCSIIFGFNRVNPMEKLKFSWVKARNSLIIGLIFVPIISLTIKLLLARFFYWDWVSSSTINLQMTIIRGLGFGLTMGLFFGIIRSLSGSGIETSTVPNQGILQSAKNAIVFALIGFILLALAAYPLQSSISFYGVIGLSFGLAAGGGEACLKHFILRVILYFSGSIPWNYARFLDYASDRIFLQKVGGGYIFIHRLLLEHFAQMELEPVRR